MYILKQLFFSISVNSGFGNIYLAAFAARQIFCHYSPRFQRIIVNCKVEEEGVSFEEHVFLEYLLDDFPSKGPVRRFMELVINGLQKNPHLTVEMKKERVGWFKNYFSDFSEEELNFNANMMRILMQLNWASKLRRV